MIDEGRLVWRRSGRILGVDIVVAFLGSRLVDFVQVDIELRVVSGGLWLLGDMG